METMPEVTAVMAAAKRENIFFHTLFEIAILLKGAFGILELSLGMLIVLVNRAAVSDFLLFLVHGELIEDPTDPFGTYISNLSNSLSTGTEFFIGLYFLSYGIIKIFLVIGLLHKKTWAYHSALVVLSTFIIYMIYRFSYTHSPILALLIVTDITTIMLIWREYMFMRKWKSIPTSLS